jgi:hypothetical protein
LCSNMASWLSTQRRARQLQPTRSLLCVRPARTRTSSVPRVPRAACRLARVVLSCAVDLVRLLSAAPSALHFVCAFARCVAAAFAHTFVAACLGRLWGTRLSSAQHQVCCSTPEVGDSDLCSLLDRIETDAAGPREAHVPRRAPAASPAAKAQVLRKNWSGGCIATCSARGLPHLHADCLLAGCLAVL